MEEKLTDVEREHVRTVAKKVTTWALWVALAALACIAGGIWFGDWRPFGIAVLLLIVAAVLLVTNDVLVDPKDEARWAEGMRTKQRARQAKEAQRRRHVEDLERDLFGSEG